MRNFAFILRPPRLLVLLASLVGLFILTSAGVWWFSKDNLGAVSRLSQDSLLQSFESYRMTLSNARWPAQRYDYFLSRKKTSTLTGKELATVQSQMIQLSFGFQAEYFLLRSLQGETRIEIKKGGLAASSFTPIRLKGEELFSSRWSGSFMRPCRIGGEAHLCLVDFPGVREFVPPRQRSYTIIGIPVEEIALKATLHHPPHRWYLADTTLTVILDDETVAITPQPQYQVASFYLPIDLGFGIQASIGMGEWLRTSLGLFLFFVVVIALLWWVVSLIAKRRVQTKMRDVLVKHRLDSLAQIQTLVRGVIHDIRSPLTAFEALSLGETEPNRRQMMDHVTKRLKTIISDLQNQARGSGAMDKVYFPLVHTIQLLVSEKVKEYAQSIDIEADLPLSELWAFGSPTEFTRAISNIVNNAVEASKADSQVTIQMKIAAHPFVEIAVVDQGKGIESEDLKRVFEAGFSRGKEGGTGRGLYHAKKVAERMGGDIELRSSVGKGTTVTIRVPSVPAPSWAVSRLELAGIQDVLVVDDEKPFFYIWEDKLKGQKKKLHYYSHPTLLTKRLVQSPQTLVLMDISFGEDHAIGLEYVQKERPANSILISSDWQIKEVQDVASQLSIPLLGKEFIDRLEV